MLYKLVTPEIVNIVCEAFEENIESKKFIELQPKIIYSLALHVETLIERVKLNQVIMYPNIEKDYKKYKVEYKIARYMKEKLESKFIIDILEDEIAFITKFIYSINKNSDGVNIQIIVITHGSGTASSMVEVAKTLLDYKYIYGIDMPLEEKVNDALNRTIRLVKSIDKGSGVLILVDMGSLATFAEFIENETGIKSRWISMISPPMVIEAERKAMEPGITLDEIVSSVENMSGLIGRRINLDKISTYENAVNLDYKEKTINMLKDIVTFIDVKKVSSILENIINDISEEYNENIDDITYVKFLFHCSCIIERAIRKEPLPKAIL